MKYVLVVLVLFLLYIKTNQNDIHTIYGPTVRTEKELKKGLMFRKHKLNDKEGMLFVMSKNSLNRKKNLQLNNLTEFYS